MKDDALVACFEMTSGLRASRVDGSTSGCWMDVEASWEARASDMTGDGGEEGKEEEEKGGVDGLLLMSRPFRGLWARSLVEVWCWR